MTPPNPRGLYAQLGIHLPAWATNNASVRCFADPDAHHRGDWSPSCSVNLATGAWNCHGCGAHGGAYDAALARGHTPRSAMNLLIAYGLAEPRPHDHRPAPRTPHMPAPGPTAEPVAAELAVDEDQIRSWAAALDADGRLVRRLILQRGWAPSVMRARQIGDDGARITIPIRHRNGSLRGVLRYDPFGPRNPKMLASPGTRLGLVPHPTTERSDRILLVEGPPDMVAARFCGLPAIAIPGTHAWQPIWARLLTGRHITIVMDCDQTGRRAAQEIAASLHPAVVSVEIVDLWPERHDGYDLTDRILERRRLRTRPSAPPTMASLLRAAEHRPSATSRDRTAAHIQESAR